MHKSSEQSIRIAVDAMGGDFAPRNEIIGALNALRDKPSGAVEIVFVGREKDIKAELAKHNTNGIAYSVVHAEEVVTMDDEPAESFRKKKNSSLYKGLELHKNGEVHAFVSAGNTGAVMTTSTLLLGRIKGVSRPTIGSFFPSTGANPTLLLDVGANVDSKPKHLYEFGVMGSIYAGLILGISSPKVGLLNVGEEKSKGNDVALQAYELLKQATNINFIGNVEGRDILTGTADVVVCDGFTGNIVLKFGESVLTLLKQRMKAYAAKGFLQKLAVGLAVPTLKKVLSDMDYQQYGGVPLLGVNGVSIIGHGSSSPLAHQNMVLLAEKIVKNNVNKIIEQALNSSSLPESAYETA